MGEGCTQLDIDSTPVLVSGHIGLHPGLRVANVLAHLLQHVVRDREHDLDLCPD